MTVKSIQSSDPETTGSHRSEPLSHEKKKVLILKLEFKEQKEHPIP